MFEGQPKGLWALAFANTGERFGYYTMLAVFILFLQANFGWTSGFAGTVYSSFLACVYFLPIIGGACADKWGYSRMVTIGIFIMFLGYVLLAVPLGSNTIAVAAMGAALLLVSLGTGLFKGNLQVMVGDLYNDPQYAQKRDAGFSLFYMLINVGAMFAPTAAIKIMEWAQQSLGVSESDSYHFAFAVACASLIVSICIYYGFKSSFSHVLTVDKKSQTASAEKAQAEAAPGDTAERIVCLCLVFAVVIFFWMAFHQNGATLTYFARDFVATTAVGITAMEMDVTNLVALILAVFALFGLFQNSKEKTKSLFAIITLTLAGFLLCNFTSIASSAVYMVLVTMATCVLFWLFKLKSKSSEVWSGVLLLACFGYLEYKYYTTSSVSISAPIFQQFNPCFVIMLTPVSIGFFGWLAKMGKEPKAPVKIGLGMLVAALAYVIMAASTMGLPAPDAANPQHLADVTPNLLVGVYLILTFAELLLSPIGISFVTKVAPAKYKGTMMGLWFGATAVGNFLVAIPTILWGSEHYVVWGTLAAICLVAALFIFSIIRKLNKVA